MPIYRGARFVIFEDIINNGTTIKEVKQLFEEKLDAEIIAAMCLINRGGQTAEFLNISQHFPLLRVKAEQYDAINCPLYRDDMPINEILGKGKHWVKIFGQPPYKNTPDLSKF